jgi:NAD(P)-dependent dehydrogenase (short-subunit alcohol dehydrogenase family)
MDYFRGKVALVTGGASGIGAELVRQLLDSGATVIIADIDEKAGTKLAAKLSGPETEVRACKADVSRPEDLLAVVGLAVQEFGRLDIIFNNAGLGLAGEVRDLELSDWKRIMDVNLWGVIHGVHAALPVMLSQGSGQIVNIASVAGLVPRPGMVPYATSKHAVVGLSTSLRYELEDLRISVNVVCPFMVATPIFDRTVYKCLDGKALLANSPLRLMSVERCVSDILRGVRQNRSIITIPLAGRLGWFLDRYCPPVASWIVRRRKAHFRKYRLT